MARRIAGVATTAVLQLIALVLAHELVFIARYGSLYGEALVHAGHGESWSAAVTWSLVLAGLLAAVAAFRLARLGLLVRQWGGEATARTSGNLAPGSLLRAWLRVAPRMTVLIIVLLSIQENLEHAAAGATVPGPAILLTPEYAGGLWITIVVGLGVALLAALFLWRRDALLARLRAARARLPRAAARLARPRERAHVPAGSLIGRESALRAPPLPSAV